MGLAGKKSPTVISTINEVLAKLLIGMKLNLNCVYFESNKKKYTKKLAQEYMQLY